MNVFHRELLEFLRANATTIRRAQYTKEYRGTAHPSYNIRVPVVRVFVKKWAAKHRNILFVEFEDLIVSLNSGQTHDEKNLVGLLLGYYPKLRKQLEPAFIMQLLNGREGWAEVDNVCQSNFSAEELLGKWNEWERVLRQLVKSREVIKQRASLVLLTGPVGESDDRRLADVAFESIEQIKHEKDILITKAISWLLRDLIKNHRKRVEEYLSQHKATLPAIAIRETINKLRTGKK